MEQIEAHGRSYRRGMLLGWTLAEVFILIVFALLLLFGQLTRRTATIKIRFDTTQRQLQEKNDANNALQRENEALKAGVNLPQKFEDTFRELVRSRNENRALRNQLESLNEGERVAIDLEKMLGGMAKNKESAKEQVQRLARDAAAAQQALAVLRDHQFLTQRNEDLPTAVKQVTEKLEQLRSTVASSGFSSGQLSSFADQMNEKNRALGSCRGSLANMQQRFAEIGRGTENPACWADSSGHVQYIFDVALTSSGVIVRKNYIQGREQDESKLPVQRIEFEKEISTATFTDETAELYEFGQAKKILNVPCRFFVRVYDKTKAEEKEIYKSHLDAVEGHFYKFKVKDRQFLDLDGPSPQ